MLSKRMSLFSKTYLYIHIRNSIVSNSQKGEVTKCSPVDECINKMECNMMEYYSASKRKEIVIHAPTWMDLEDKS